MSQPTCPELQAWAALLHAEASLGVEAASSRGAEWEGFTDQIAMAAHCESLADTIDERVAEEC